MKAFSLWLFKLCWRREIARELKSQTHRVAMFGRDYTQGFEAGIECTLASRIARAMAE